jgi:hypothetical protein
LHIIEDIEAITKKKNKGYYAPAKHTIWLPISQMGTINKSFIHRGKWKRENRRDKPRNTSGETHSQIVTEFCHFIPIMPLPPLVNYGKFLD